MIMDRSGTRTSVAPHKFAKVPWLKLRRDDTVLNSELKIPVFSTSGNQGNRLGGRETNTPEEETDGNTGNG